MANAIKKISVQRGYDVTRYTMNCFGGAGGQHACLVADALGMERIFIHPFAGVLSAFGMGLADVRAMREQQFEKPLDDAAAEDALNKMAQAAANEVLDQGIAPHDIKTLRRAQIRPRDAQQSLEVDFGTARDMETAFVEAHKQRFGFVPETSDLIIDVLVVEAIGETGEAVSLPDPRAGDANAVNIPVCFEGEWQDVSLVDRTTLVVGASVDGPAILTEPTGTNVIEPGWRATVAAGGNLILERVVPIERAEAIGTSVDPVMLEVFNNLFMSIAEQMGVSLGQYRVFGQHQGAAGLLLRACLILTATWWLMRRMCRCTWDR